eukprot:TRINITY_DN4079_c0_g1_i4.p1 TRINITY_DN4079_c0_g1~~TRINITY_DN4079_c0_g1_i4.p1  ORF type:complete len:278 (+),score=32.48 TRINITY_DN4079_c0_g1_i4:23-856(+)
MILSLGLRRSFPYVCQKRWGSHKPEQHNQHVIIAVSGTLQDGFPLRPNLDYYNTETNEAFPAKFLGWGLARGVKSYFDIKDKEAREYVKPGEGLARVNPGLVPTGNWEDANVYAIYRVHEEQAMQALLHEPRFLSMTPDLVKIDLEAKETSPKLKNFFKWYIESKGFSNKSEIALTTVISTYKGPSFVENPVLYTSEDGTRVTNFHEGLAKWAGTSDQLRGTPEYYNAIEHAIREAEGQITVQRVLGVDHNTAQFNEGYVLADFKRLEEAAGVDFTE